MAIDFLTPFKRLDSIRSTEPELTPNNWCQVQPCATVHLFGKRIILTQPSSTLLVYLLGVLTIGVGLNFLWQPGGEASGWWWGISMLLWGAGALLAGTSYQAFGYHIKCQGRTICAWTSWWEVVYLMFQQLSINALLVAVAYACTTAPWQQWAIGYALVCAILYVIVTFAGAIIPVKTLITFELMVWVSTPAFVFLLGLNSWRYYIFNTSMDLVLVFAWVWLLITMLAYWLYDKLGLTGRLWASGKGFWFSQNDVLHVGLIIWMLYIALIVTPRINDLIV
jgi:hypothetical protein